MRKQAIYRLMIIFMDSFTSADIHLHPITEYGVNKAVIFYDESDGEFSPFKQDLVDALDHFSIEHEEYPNHNFDCLRSLITFDRINDTLRYYSADKSYNMIYINASTGYLPAVFSLIDFYEIYNMEYELIYLRHDSGGNWYNKMQNTITTGPYQTNFLKKEHLKFISLLFANHQQKNNQFSIADLIQYEKELGFMNGIDVESENPRARKRLFDFLAPLYKRKFLTKERIKRYLTISLNLR